MVPILTPGELAAINSLPGLKAIFKGGVSLDQIFAASPILSDSGDEDYYVELGDKYGRGYLAASRDSIHGFYLRLTAGLYLVKIPNSAMTQFNVSPSHHPEDGLAQRILLGQVMLS